VGEGGAHAGEIVEGESRSSAKLGNKERGGGGWE